MKDDLFMKTAQMAISDDELNQSVKEHVEYIDRVFEKEKKKSFIPSLSVMSLKKYEGKRKESLIVFADFDENRHKLLLNLGEQWGNSKQFFPVCVTLMSEAWTRSFKNMKEHTKDKISDYNDKSEVIIVAAMTFDCRTSMAMIKIHRAKDNTIILDPKPMFNPYTGKSLIETNLVANFYKGYQNVLRQRST